MQRCLLPMRASVPDHALFKSNASVASMPIVKQYSLSMMVVGCC